MELKDLDNLKFDINRIISTGANDNRFLDMIERYISKNYWTDWKVGDVIKNGCFIYIIEDISLCVLTTDGDETYHQPISELKEQGYEVDNPPEITPETIALKFNVDVETVNLLLKKIK